MQYADRQRAAYRGRLAAKVARLADLVEQWEVWEAEQHLPLAHRRGTRPAIGGREALRVLHRAALAELHDLDGAPWVWWNG